jgi:hypothetical protein
VESINKLGGKIGVGKILSDLQRSLNVSVAAGKMTKDQMIDIMSTQKRNLRQLFSGTAEKEKEPEQPHKKTKKEQADENSRRIQQRKEIATNKPEDVWSILKPKAPVIGSGMVERKQKPELDIVQHTVADKMKSERKAATRMIAGKKAAVAPVAIPEPTLAAEPTKPMPVPITASKQATIEKLMAPAPAAIMLPEKKLEQAPAVPVVPAENAPVPTLPPEIPMTTPEIPKIIEKKPNYIERMDKLKEDIEKQNEALKRFVEFQRKGGSGKSQINFRAEVDKERDAAKIKPTLALPQIQLPEIKPTEKKIGSAERVEQLKEDTSRQNEALRRLAEFQKKGGQGKSQLDFRAEIDKERNAAAKMKKTVAPIMPMPIEEKKIGSAERVEQLKEDTSRQNEALRRLAEFQKKGGSGKSQAYFRAQIDKEHAAIAKSKLLEEPKKEIEKMAAQPVVPAQGADLARKMIEKTPVATNVPDIAASAKTTKDVKTAAATAAAPMAVGQTSKAQEIPLELELTAKVKGTSLVIDLAPAVKKVVKQLHIDDVHRHQ